MHLLKILNFFRMTETIEQNQRAEDLVCELLKNLSRYQVVIADLQHRNPADMQSIFKAFPVLERNKIPPTVVNLHLEAEQAIRAAYNDFIREICKSEYFVQYPSLKILQEIIYTGFPLHTLYEILNSQGREILCSLLPGINKNEANQLEVSLNETDSFRDVYDYKVVNTPVIYQGMQYDFSRLMQYILSCRAMNKPYTVGFARNEEVDLTGLHVDFQVVDNMHKKLAELIHAEGNAVTWRSDLLNNYLLVEQQGAALEYIKNFRALSLSKQILYIVGMLLTIQSIYKFIDHDLDYRYNTNVCKFRFPLDYTYILGGGVLEHFRFLPMTFNLTHDFIRLIYASVDGECSKRQALENFVKITVPYYYISALDRILFVPLTRSKEAWLECADVGDGVKRNWAPYFVMGPALISAHALAFAVVKKATNVDFEKLMYSRNRLIQMLGLIFTAHAQNMLQDYYEENFVMQDTRETYMLMLLAGASLVTMFELFWTFYAAPGIKFTMDLSSKLYSFAPSLQDVQYRVQKEEQNKVLEKMEFLQHNNQSVPFKEGLFFWNKNYVQTQTIPIETISISNQMPEIQMPRLVAG